jgi:hypothetical protein
MTSGTFAHIVLIQSQRNQLTPPQLETAIGQRLSLKQGAEEKHTNKATRKPLEGIVFSL